MALAAGRGRAPGTAPPGHIPTRLTSKCSGAPNVTRGWFGVRTGCSPGFCSELIVFGLRTSLGLHPDFLRSSHGDHSGCQSAIGRCRSPRSEPIRSRITVHSSIEQCGIRGGACSMHSEGTLVVTSGRSLVRQGVVPLWLCAAFARLRKWRSSASTPLVVSCSGRVLSAQFLFTLLQRAGKWQ